MREESLRQFIYCLLIHHHWILHIWQIHKYKTNFTDQRQQEEISSTIFTICSGTTHTFSVGQSFIFQPLYLHEQRFRGPRLISDLRRGSIIKVKHLTWNTWNI